MAWHSPSPGMRQRAQGSGNAWPASLMKRGKIGRGFVTVPMTLSVRWAPDLRFWCERGSSPSVAGIEPRARLRGAIDRAIIHSTRFADAASCQAIREQARPFRQRFRRPVPSAPACRPQSAFRTACTTERSGRSGRACRRLPGMDPSQGPTAGGPLGRTGRSR